MPAPFRVPPLILIGFMGSGKSCVARRLARELCRNARDLDAMIEAEAGCTIPQLFAREGEDAFRARESQALRLALKTSDVLATGGGIVNRSENRALLKKAAATGAQVIYLRAQPLTLARRIRRQPGKRPLIDRDGVVLDLAATRERVEELLTRRTPFYEECATLIVDTDELQTFAVARLIAQHLQDKRA